MTKPVSTPEARAHIKSALSILLSKKQNEGALRSLAPGPSQKHAIFGTPLVVVKLHKDPTKSGAHEKNVLSALSGTSFAPPLLAYQKPNDNFGGMLVLGRISGKSPSQLNQKNAASIAGAIYELHQFKTRAKLTQQNGTASAQDLFDTLPELVAALPTAAQQRAFLKRIKHERSVFEALGLKKAKACLIHGDLRLHNLLVSKTKTTLIDFETACRGDPAIDLALFIAREGLDDVSTFLLLEAYALQAHNIEVVRRCCALLPSVRLAGALGAWQKLAAFDEGAHPIFGDAKAWRKKAKKRAQDETLRALRDDPTPQKGKALLTTPLPFQSIEHLPNSTMAHDDITLPKSLWPTFHKGQARVYEKLDGINVIIRPEHKTLVHVKKKWRNAASGKMLLSLQAFAYLHEAYFRAVIPKGCALVFEWLRFSLSVRYGRLPHVLMCIAAIDRDGYAMPHSLAERWIKDAAQKRPHPFEFSRPLFEGSLSKSFEASSFVKRSAYGSKKMEGVIVERLKGDPLFAKWVRAGYVSPTPDDVDVEKLNHALVFDES